MSLVAVLAMPVGLIAQEPSPTQEQKLNPVRYTITDLGTVEGGTFSQPFSINKYGLVAGSSTLSDNQQHAVLWSKGLIADLGTLGGSNSYAFGVNARDRAVGEAETSAQDPNGEDFCGFGTHLICQPFSWAHGVMTPLPTLGGNNGVANQINDLGVVVGDAENTTPDTACPAPQIFQTKPVIWANGKVNELPTFPGDPEGLALSSNEIGQVVGASGICAAFNTNTLAGIQPVHPLLWQKGKVTDLGNLGGTTGQAGGNMAFDLNNRGEVVGISDLAGDTTFHGFLWTKPTGMLDLGTLSGDTYSNALSINDAGDVAGLSLDANFNARAFLWHKGVMTDLNTVVARNPPLYLLTACSINSSGEITGLGATSTGETHTYLATPTGGAAAGESRSQSGVHPMVLSEDARMLMQRQLRFGRSGVPRQ